MKNEEIAEYFSAVSRLIDLHGEDSFRSKSYSIAAFTIERLQEEIEQMDDAHLFAIKGIGERTGRKIRELIHTGKLPQLEQLLAATPSGVLQILRIKGLGPKKTAVIWKELGIESIGELEYACHENRLASCKGFGVKTQEAVLKSIEFMRNSEGLFLWAEADAFATSILNTLHKAMPECRSVATGALRRQCEVLDGVDILTEADSESIIEVLAMDPQITSELVGQDQVNVQYPMQPLLRVHLTHKENFYRSLSLTTGSMEFLDAFDTSRSLLSQIESEESIFEANGLSFIPAPQREHGDVLLQVKQGTLKPLIRTSDIKGIIHSHSKWSDGSNTIEEMAIAARNKGFEYLVISDHSQSAYYASGLSPERIAAQHQEVDDLNRRLAPFRIFKSIESDILNDGSLDYSSSVLATFDLVIASVHSNLKMSQGKAMERVLAAIRNPYTTILGHPTGRLLLSRPGYPLDLDILIAECVAHQVVIEINAHPRRLDLDWRWISAALKAGAMLSINPDAHNTAGFGDVHYGVMAAQKGGLFRERNLSSFSLQEMEEFVTKRHSDIVCKP